MGGAAAAGDRDALSRLRVGGGRRAQPPSARRRRNEIYRYTGDQPS
ncbi:hypothetical protein [Streptomyces rishiriensis]